MKGTWQIMVIRTAEDGTSLSNRKFMSLKWESQGADQTVANLCYLFWKTVVEIIRMRDADKPHWYPKYPSDAAIVVGAHNGEIND